MKNVKKDISDEIFFLSMAAPKDLQDVTLALADPDLINCWERNVKQRRKCSLLLELRNGKVPTTLKVGNSETRTPKPNSKSLAKNNKKEKGAKKQTKLPAYQKFLVDEKGLPPKNLTIQHAAGTSSPSQPPHKPRQDGGS